MLRRVSSLILGLALLASVPAGAQSLTAEAPLPFGPARPAASGLLLTAAAARQALEAGLPTVAADLYGRAFAASTAEARDERNRLVLDWVTALLDDGRVPEAEEVLARWVGPPTAGLSLRRAMVALRGRQYERARTELAAVRVTELGEADRGWYAFAQAQLADSSGDFGRAATLHERAREAAVTEAQRARFALAREELRLLGGEVTDAQIAGLRALAERNPGRATGYEAVSQLAVALHLVGRPAEAVDLLRRQLQSLPLQERAVADEWNLLLGLIAGAADPAGRAALLRLLQSAGDREKQRVALLLLARGAPTTAFRLELNRLIEAPTPHPILEDLLLQRAELLLAARSFAEAEADAQRLVDTFPGTRLKPHALALRMRVAWENSRYRRAADYAAQARAALPPDEVELRAELGVLLAEAYFRAPDYALAAEAYSAASREPPSGVPAGDLVYQRVVAEIEGARGKPENLARAAAIIDDSAREQRLDLNNRWQIEWNLARALQASGVQATRVAFERIDRLLGAGPTDPVVVAAVPEELRVRLAWLRARLALAVGQPDRARALAEVLLDSLQTVGQPLRTELASTARLLLADAFFAIPDRAPEGLEVLRRLRADFPQSDATVYSYIVEARLAALQNRYVDAQSLLVKLADDFPRHLYAPFALYEAAVNAERRAQETSYLQANTLIERLVERYAGSELVFHARLKQGDLLRKLNRFVLAQQVYAEIVNVYPKHPDVFFAHLALAACHHALAGPEPESGVGIGGHTEAALGIYERLVDQADAPVDVRIEAGYNLGLLLSRRGAPDQKRRAPVIWWDQVVAPFLLDDQQAERLDGRARYWLSRTLVGLGEYLEAEERLDQAASAYRLILERGLPGEALAKSKLARFGGAR
jgi:cellulose synthase operon protein C